MREVVYDAMGSPIKAVTAPSQYPDSIWLFVHNGGQHSPVKGVSLLNKEAAQNLIQMLTKFVDAP